MTVESLFVHIRRQWCGYIRLFFAYHSAMGEMKRAMAREEEASVRERFASTIAICAAIIAAVRLSNSENIVHPSPRLNSVVRDSVELARTILNRVLGR